MKGHTSALESDFISDNSLARLGKVLLWLLRFVPLCLDFPHQEGFRPFLMSMQGLLSNWSRQSLRWRVQSPLEVQTQLVFLSTDRYGISELSHFPVLPSTIHYLGNLTQLPESTYLQVEDFWQILTLLHRTFSAWLVYRDFSSVDSVVSLLCQKI